MSVDPASRFGMVKDRYPRKDGNTDKLAVQGLSLALPHGECFGVLGPNGAGKTSVINMVYMYHLTIFKHCQIFIKSYILEFGYFLGSNTTAT